MTPWISTYVVKKVENRYLIYINDKYFSDNFAELPKLFVIIIIIIISQPMVRGPLPFDQMLNKNMSRCCSADLDHYIVYWKLMVSGEGKLPWDPWGQYSE